MTSHVITNGELEMMIYNRLAQYGHITDSGMGVIDKAWLVSELLPSFYGFIAALKTNGYVIQVNDCDDFALALHFFARLCNARSRHGEKIGIAIGEMHCRPDTGGYHALNLAVAATPEKQLDLVFIEPQTQKLIELSVRERMSCDFVYF